MMDRARAWVLPQFEHDWELVLDDGSIDGTWASLGDCLERHRTAIEESPAIDLWISPMRVVGHPPVLCARRPGERVHIDRFVGVGMLAITIASLRAAGGLPHRYAEDSVFIHGLRANGIRQRRLHERTDVYDREHAEAITRTRLLAG